jgi:uncharacterized membrane protein
VTPENREHRAIVTILRVGVVSSVAIMLAGMAVTFLRHPEYVSPSPALGTLTSPKAHYPNTLLDVASGVRSGQGEAIVMAGLLVLIATPAAAGSPSSAIPANSCREDGRESPRSPIMETRSRSRLHSRPARAA